MSSLKILQQFFLLVWLLFIHGNLHASDSLFNTSVLSTLYPMAGTPAGHDALKAAARINYFLSVETPRLNAIAKIYFNRTQKIEEQVIYLKEVEQMANDFIKANGIFQDLNKGNLSDAVGGELKIGASKLIESRALELAESLPIQAESQALIANKVSSWIDLVVFDVLGELDPKQKMANALMGLSQELLSASISLGGVFAIKGAYERFDRTVHIGYFLKDYYFCDSDLACVRAMNGINVPVKWDSYSEEKKFSYTVDELFIRKQLADPYDKHVVTATDDDVQAIKDSIETTEAVILDRLAVYLEKKKEPVEPQQPAQYAITVGKVGRGLVTSEPSAILCGSICGEYFIENETVQLIASPSEGYRFEKWSGGCSGSNTTCNLGVDGAYGVVAHFEEIPKPIERNLHVVAVGNGRITSNGINCGVDCTEEFESDAVLTLNAIPDSALYRLSGWSESSCATSESCTILVNEPTTITGVFESCISLDYLWQKTAPLYAGEINNFDAQLKVTNN